MAQKVFKVCWMSNEQGEEFIPKTILESIETASGTPLKEYIATKNLSDAKLTNVKHGQILEYDEASKKWVNKNAIEVTPEYEDGLKILTLVVGADTYDIYAPISDITEKDIEDAINIDKKWEVEVNDVSGYESI